MIFYFKKGNVVALERDIREIVKDICIKVWQFNNDGNLLLIILFDTYYYQSQIHLYMNVAL